MTITKATELEAAEQAAYTAWAAAVQAGNLVEARKYWAVATTMTAEGKLADQ